MSHSCARTGVVEAAKGRCVHSECSHKHERNSKHVSQTNTCKVKHTQPQQAADALKGRCRGW